MYLDSKVPELLLLSLKNISGSSEIFIKLNTIDIKKLYVAREYILTHLRKSMFYPATGPRGGLE
jgi:hypothetical protein